MKKRYMYNIPCNESEIVKTIAASKSAYAEEESKSMVSYVEFLYMQSKYIKKYWWVVQAVLLFLLWLIMNFSESEFYLRRSLGVAAPLFVIFIMPEFWKNRSCNAMEVEGTTFYTIRQVYAARLTLFAGIDLFLLTAFFFLTYFFTSVSIWELLIQFVLPLNVACCICFQNLYNGGNNSEAFSILLCSLWTGIWVLIVLSDTVYNAISVPVWIAMVVTSSLYMGYSIRKGQKTIYKLWEVKMLWN